MQPRPAGKHLGQDATAARELLSLAFSNMLTKNLAAAEPTLYFPVSFTLCHADRKEDLKVVYLQAL